METLLMQTTQTSADGTILKQEPDVQVIKMFRMWMKTSGWLRFYSYEESVADHKNKWDEMYGATIEIALTNGTCQIYPHSKEEELRWKAVLEADYGPMMDADGMRGYGF